MPTCNHERAVKYTLICLLYQTEGLHGNCGTYCRQNICVSGEIISTCKLNMHAQVICQFTKQILLTFSTTVVPSLGIRLQKYAVGSWYTLFTEECNMFTLGYVITLKTMIRFWLVTET